MKKQDLSSLDFYQRKLWMLYITDTELHYETEDPILLQEIETLTNEAEKIIKLLESDGVGKRDMPKGTSDAYCGAYVALRDEGNKGFEIVHTK